MLTADLVKVSRKKGVLVLVERCGLSVARAAELLDELLAVAREHHGQTRGELVAAFDDVVVDAAEDKGLRAARKLVLDRLDFNESDDLDPFELRQLVFSIAATARKEGRFDRAVVVNDAARVHGIAPDVLEAALYADLEDAHLVDAAALPAEGKLMVDEWAHKEIQALLLRATEVTVDVDATPAQLRRLLRALKLQQLLFRVPSDSEGDGGLVRLVIDGPMGLFSSSTRYGMKLALLLPHVLACRVHRLEAQVQLRKGGKSEPFVVKGVGAGVDVDEPLPPLVQGLVDELPAYLPGCLVAPSSELLPVKGHGALVPDVVVSDAQGRRAFVEILGFWSRPAVWARVELVEQGVLPAPVVFCFSERLRVSEEAIDDDTSLTGGGALLSFKGALSAKRVAEKLAALFAAQPTTPKTPTTTTTTTATSTAKSEPKKRNTRST